MRPHADSAASAARFGRCPVSSSERPVSGRGRPPRPSTESTTIFVVFWTTSGAISSSIDRARSRLLHRVLEPPEPGDLHCDDVTRLEVHGRLLAEPDAGRRSGGDEIAGRERHQPREIAHEVADVEDERLRVAALHLLAVHPGPELEGVWVGDLLPVGDVGADGRRSLEDLPGHPLARDELEVPRARVVDDRVPPHVVERLLCGTRAAAISRARTTPRRVRVAARLASRSAMRSPRSAPRRGDCSLVEKRTSFMASGLQTEVVANYSLSRIFAPRAV